MKKFLMIMAGTALLITGGVCPANSYARPVSYKGGWTLESKADIGSFWALMHYTPQRWYSVGARSEVFKDGWMFTGLQANVLAKRWNEEKWQANFYVRSGAGFLNTTSRSANKCDAGVFSGVAADWEDRRFYAGYENRFMYAGGIESFVDQNIRLGIAPYIAHFGDIHTWLMVDLKCKVTRHRETEYNVVPLVRFFKGPIMAEAGASVKGEVYFSWRMLF
jgi:hypothetical protein